MTTLSNEEIWSILLKGLGSQALLRVESLFPEGAQPPFFQFVLDVIETDAASGRPSPTSAALMDSGLVIHALSEPAILELAEAIRLAKAAVKLDYRLDDKLLNRLTGSPRWPAGVPKVECARVLEVIDAISDCQRLVLPLMKFMKLPPHQLRSKAVKLIARARRNPSWAESILTDPDPRVRSNLIDGLAQQRGDQIDILLRKGAADRHHRVSIAALLQLCHRGDQPSCEKIRTLAREGDAPHRRAAEWALKHIDSSNPSDLSAAPTNPDVPATPAPESQAAQPALQITQPEPQQAPTEPPLAETN